MTPEKTRDRNFKINLSGMENALQDYEDASYRSVSGKYECRECGRLFDTLEAHDLHWRKVHSETEAVPVMPM